MSLPRLLVSRSFKTPTIPTANLFPRTTLPTQHCRFPIQYRAYASSPESATQPSAQSGGARSKEAAETGSSPTGGKLKNAMNNAADSEESGGKGLKEDGNSGPAISSRFTPGKDHDEPSSEEKKREVEQHNQEFEKGHDRAPATPVKDQVDERFWSGQGARDKEP